MRDNFENIHAPRNQISASGRQIGDLHFTITVSNECYSIEQVAEQLTSGALHLYFEDTAIFDDDGDLVGTVSWEEDKGNFIIRTADPLYNNRSVVPAVSIRQQL